MISHVQRFYCPSVGISCYFSDRVLVRGLLLSGEDGVVSLSRGSSERNRCLHHCYEMEPVDVRGAMPWARGNIGLLAEEGGLLWWPPVGCAAIVWLVLGAALPTSLGGAEHPTHIFERVQPGRLCPEALPVVYRAGTPLRYGTVENW